MIGAKEKCNSDKVFVKVIQVLNDHHLQVKSNEYSFNFCGDSDVGKNSNENCRLSIIRIEEKIKEENIISIQIPSNQGLRISRNTFKNKIKSKLTNKGLQADFSF